jgi:hypothetical protein
VKSRIGIFGLAVSILFALFSSAYAIATPKPLRPIAAGDVLSGWIVGQDVAGYSCWNQLDNGQIAVLQVQVSRKWISKVKGLVLKNSQYCTDPAYRVTIAYHWIVNAKGSPTTSSSKSRSITAREIIVATRTSKMIVTPPFTKILYLTLEDSVAPINDAISGFLGMLGNGTASTYPRGTADAGRISSNCTFKGKFRGGRVKIVEVGADFNVKVVNSFEDLNVHRVNIGNACGEWQVVDIGADFNVKLVNSFEDFSIKFVDFGSGLP